MEEPTTFPPCVQVGFDRLFEMLTRNSAGLALNIQK